MRLWWSYEHKSLLHDKHLMGNFAKIKNQGNQKQNQGKIREIIAKLRKLKPIKDIKAHIPKFRRIGSKPAARQPVSVGWEDRLCPEDVFPGDRGSRTVAPRPLPTRCRTPWTPWSLWFEHTKNQVSLYPLRIIRDTMTTKLYAPGTPQERSLASPAFHPQSKPWSKKCLIITLRPPLAQHRSGNAVWKSKAPCS